MVEELHRQPVTTTAPRASVVVREADRADLLEVFRIEQASFPQPWPYSAFESFLGRRGFLVADNERVVGYVVADTVPNQGRALGHVKDIAVHPDHRSRGIGQTLLERALGILRLQGASRVKLEVRENNESALALYRKYDFDHHHTVPRYYDNGEDALVLMRDLE